MDNGAISVCIGSLYFHALGDLENGSIPSSFGYITRKVLSSYLSEFVCFHRLWHRISENQNQCHQDPGERGRMRDDANIFDCSPDGLSLVS